MLELIGGWRNIWLGCFKAVLIAVGHKIPGPSRIVVLYCLEEQPLCITVLHFWRYLLHLGLGTHPLDQGEQHIQLLTRPLTVLSRRWYTLLLVLAGMIVLLPCVPVIFERKNWTSLNFDISLSTFIRIVEIFCRISGSSRLHEALHMRVFFVFPNQRRNIGLKTVFHLLRVETARRLFSSMWRYLIYWR